MGRATWLTQRASGSPPGPLVVVSAARSASSIARAARLRAPQRSRPGRVSEGGGTASPPDYLTVKRPLLHGRRLSCGSEGTRARTAPPSRWSRASPAAGGSRAPRRAACGCGRNDTRTGLRRKETDSTSSRSTPTWRLDYASSVSLPHDCEAFFRGAVLGVLFFVLDGINNANVLPRPHRVRVHVRHPGAFAATPVRKLMAHRLVGVFLADPADHAARLASRPVEPGLDVAVGSS
jgi:hypothetical protein